MAPNLPERRIVALAARQHGSVTRQQLMELGLGPDAIKHRVGAGRLHPIHLGVYSLGRPPMTTLERAAAAVLACGPGAALSHLSALALWGLRSRWPASFDVTVIRDRRPRGIRVHRPTGLSGRDFRKHMGIRVTSPARTLLDCAPQLSDKALTRAVNDALRSEHLRRSQLLELLARCPGRRAAARLTPFVTRGGSPTRSEFEDAFLAFCESFGFPRPRVNTRVRGHEADAFFGAEKLIVELDGWDFHSSRSAFESDRDRDADALAAGYSTVRITWDRLVETPRREADRLHAILESRRGS